VEGATGATVITILKLYREECAAKLLDIVLYPEKKRGTGRQFIP
jgi:hypothetical protein